MQSRGLSEEKAVNMIINSYSQDIIQKLDLNESQQSEFYSIINVKVEDEIDKAYLEKPSFYEDRSYACQHLDAPERAEGRADAAGGEPAEDPVFRGSGYHRGKTGGTV